EPTSGGRDERVDRAAPTARGTLAALLVAPLRGCDDELTSQQNEKLVRQEHAHLAPTTSEGARRAFFMWKLRATRSWAEPLRSTEVRRGRRPRRALAPSACARASFRAWASQARERRGRSTGERPARAPGDGRPRARGERTSS